MLKWLLRLILMLSVAKSKQVDRFMNFMQNPNNISDPMIYGLSAQGSRNELQEDGSIQIQSDQMTSILLFGSIVGPINLTFTTVPKRRNEDCGNLDHTLVYTTKPLSVGVSVIHVKLSKHDGNYFICLQSPDRRWYHQGNESIVAISTKSQILPITVQIIFIIVLLCLSGLFSGLNLGLMALDKNELQVIARCGTESEKRYAKAIAPVRKRGNYLLCSLLLGNVLVNSSLTILLDDLTSGFIAIIGSTLAIVIFGEIIPQAACSRHGLAVGAKTIFLTYLFMMLTFPLSYPISRILDKLLGDEIGNVYDRERLMEYIKVTKTYNKLEEDEMNIISGALGLKTKTVGEVMTRLEDAFMLPINAVLDFNTVSEVSKKGYSRIPVYDGERKNIVALLHVKDLAFIDLDDETPLKTVIDFYKHQLIHTYEDETLNNVLNHFKHGKSHMAFVRKIYDTGEEDPYYEITGIVTLEDVIEEILQMEIVDETDILIDNRKKQRRKGAQARQDFSDFARIGSGNQGSHFISSQLALATFQYLSTAVNPFKKPLINETVLRRLIAQKIYFCVKVEDNSKAQEKLLYTAGKSADYFIMILEGRVQVKVGNENLVFEAGPFTYFGTSALRLTAQETNMLKQLSSSRPPTPDSPESTSLNQEKDSKLVINASTSNNTNSIVNFIPDYTVKIIENTLYMKINRNVYLAAYKASQMERKKEWLQDEDKFKKEIDTAITSSLGGTGIDSEHREACLFLSSTEEPRRNSKSSVLKIGLKASSPSIKKPPKVSSSPSTSSLSQNQKSVSSEKNILAESTLKDSHLIQMP